MGGKEVDKKSSIVQEVDMKNGRLRGFRRYYASKSARLGGHAGVKPDEYYQGEMATKAMVGIILVSSSVFELCEHPDLRVG